MAVGSDPTRSFSAIPNHFGNWTPSDTLRFDYPVAGWSVKTTGNVRVLDATDPSTPVDVWCIGGIQYAGSIVAILATGTDAVGTITIYYAQ